MVLPEQGTLPAKDGLLAVLYLEAIIYLGIGVVELFVIDFIEPPKYVRNAFEGYFHSMSKKFHASVCMVLGACALQGIVAGEVSRFELEMMFFTLGLVMNMVWTGFALPIGAKGWLISIALKPEFWFQIWIWCTKCDAVRIPILVVSALLNIHGLVLAILVLKPKMGDAQSFEKMLDESDPEMKAKFEKIGIFAKPIAESEPLQKGNA
mmetsp:Transcript_81412/g.143737  ORF Transcript_81412/g.143737 Transcript_81412/m.143737 type:complete len:208 (+) Transcript_81412:61-684(+)